MRWTRAAALSGALLFCAAAGGADRPLSSIGGKLPPDSGSRNGLLFLVGGDNRPTGKGAPLPRVARTIFEEIGLIRPDFVLWTGDTVYGYGDTPAELSREYSVFESLAAKTRVPLFNAPGNHEIHRDDDFPCSTAAPTGPAESESQFIRRFGNLYGFFDVGPVHFISLDTEVSCHEDAIEGAQLEWLKGDLEAHKNAAAIFVFSHTEFFSSPQIDPAAGQDHKPLRNRDELHALFRKYPVKAVFSGHEHLYWRESHDGIEYFVAGGGGAPLYAPPERGGFGHYILVSLSDAGVQYDLVEPGRLFVQEGGLGSKPEGKPESNRREKSVWVVNSNDADIPLRGVAVDWPGPGPCSALRAESNLRRRDGTAVPVPVSKLSCSRSRGVSRVTLGLTAPRRTSVPVLLRSP